MLALLTLLAASALPEPPPPPDAPPEPISSGDRRRGPFSRDAYPSEVIARPLTLPAGMVRADAALDALWLRLTTTTWSSFFGFAASYGLTDRLEVTASGGLELSPLVASQRLSLSGTWLLLDGEIFDLALQAGADVTPSLLLPSPGVSLAVPARVLLSDQIFLTFGVGLLRVQPVPFSLQAALRMGLGAQIGGSVAVTLDTDLARLVLRELPLGLGATVAVARGFDLRARAAVFTLLNPRLAGVFSLAGSMYF